MMETRTDINLTQNLIIALRAAVDAAKIIMQFYDKTYDVDYKEDTSPLTSADLAAHKCIEQYLLETGLPVLSEEGKSIPFDERNQWNYFWMVDPLDGTKEFIKKNGEFTVNIALIHQGIPILGVVCIPVTSVVYFACTEYGSYRSHADDMADHWADLHKILSNSVKLPEVQQRQEVIMGSRSHNNPDNQKLINAFIEMYKNVQLITAGSSLKFCKLAEGSADFYPRLSPTMEWDTAAGHAICRFADVSVINYTSGEELNYNKMNLLNPDFIAIRNKYNSFLNSALFKVEE